MPSPAPLAGLPWLVLRLAHVLGGTGRGWPHLDGLCAHYHVGWGGVGEQEGDVADGFGSPLPENHAHAHAQVLRVLDEAEVDQGFVAGPQAVHAHAKDGGRLPDAATVDCKGNVRS